MTAKKADNVIMDDEFIQRTYMKLYPDRQLKQMQLEIISSIIAGKDVLAILATGFGKSVGYQLPYLIFNKSVIVISPLLALMKNQKSALDQLNIPCVCFNSEMDEADKEKEKMLLTLTDANKIIYMTPEYFVKSEQFIAEMNASKKLCLFAIDEAHCISLWGHEFRKDYMSLQYMKKWANGIPIYACTATATENVKKDIIKCLNFDKSAVIIESSFARDNLLITCNKKTEVLADVIPYLNKYKDDSNIIYVKTQDESAQLAELLVSKGIKAQAYHGALSKKVRSEVQENFMTKKINCIVATIAFGMGIDHHVHLVIHYGLSNDIESYYQEIGRAGRDGVESTCVLFWNKKDVMIAKSLLKNVESDDLRKYRESKLKLMEKYVLSDACRKKLLLNYFDEKFDNSCGKCDSCIKNEENIKKQKGKYDPVPLFEPTYLIMKTFMEANKGLGTKKIIDIIKGRNNKGVLEYKHLETYNKGAKYSEPFLKELINFMTYKDLLIERTVKKSRITYLTIHINGINTWLKIKDQKDVFNNEIWNFNDIPESYTALYSYILAHNTDKDKFSRLDEYEKILYLDDLDDTHNT